MEELPLPEIQPQPTAHDTTPVHSPQIPLNPNSWTPIANVQAQSTREHLIGDFEVSMEAKLVYAMQVQQAQSAKTLYEPRHQPLDLQGSASRPA